jgi:hypothetical protein
VEYHRIEIAQGKEVLLADLKCPGKVSFFYITDDTQGKFFPGLVLKVVWNDEVEPSILVPLSDFFGAVHGTTMEIGTTHRAWPSPKPCPLILENIR